MLRTKVGANRLLAKLPRPDRQRLLAISERVDLKFADILCEPEETLAHVYFPTNSFISLLTPVAGHAGLEVALVGSEGMFGIQVALGIDASPLRALVQGSGSALCMEVSSFRRVHEKSAALRRGLNRYLYVLMSQIAATAACTHFHILEARLARWLLMTQDRARSVEFKLTQEFLAYMLGVRRVGVTNAARSLQERKLIRYSRGHITVLDRRGLEAASCRCYESERRMYARILG